MLGFRLSCFVLSTRSVVFSFQVGEGGGKGGVEIDCVGS